MTSFIIPAPPPPEEAAIGKPVLAFGEPYHHYGLVKDIEQRGELFLITFEPRSVRVIRATPNRYGIKAKSIAEYRAEYNVQGLFIEGHFTNGSVFFLCREFELEPLVDAISPP